MATSQFSLLKTRRFLPLFVTQFMGALNDNVFKNALGMMIIYHAAGNMGMDQRILTTASAGIFILPFFLFSATAGQIADKFEKSRVIRLIKFIEILLMLAASAGFILNNYWILMSVLFCAGTHSTFFGPLKYSILPDLLPEKELIGGNALVEAGTFLSILVGTILSGILILQSNGVLLISGVLLGVAVCGWVASRQIPKAPPVDGKLKINGNFIFETWNIVRHATKVKDVFLSILGVSWFWLVGFTFLAEFPAYAKDVLGANEGVVTLFLTVFSVGIALGSLICNKLLKGTVSGAYVPLGAFGMTASIIALWLASPRLDPHAVLMGLWQFIALPQSWAILLSLLAIAIFSGLYIVPLYAIMQTRCEKTHRSRTIAANNIVNALFMVLGAVVTMLLLKLNMSVSDIFLTIGLANIPAAFLVRRIVKIRRAAKQETGHA